MTLADQCAGRPEITLCIPAYEKLRKGDWDTLPLHFPRRQDHKIELHETTSLPSIGGAPPGEMRTRRLADFSEPAGNRKLEWNCSRQCFFHASQHGERRNLLYTRYYEASRDRCRSARDAACRQLLGRLKLRHLARRLAIIPLNPEDRVAKVLGA